MTEGKSRRGFASMTPERRREVSSKGGRSSAPESRYFARNQAAAVEAGRRGGNRKAIKERQRAQEAEDGNAIW